MAQATTVLKTCCNLFFH